MSEKRWIIDGAVCEGSNGITGIPQSAILCPDSLNYIKTGEKVPEGILDFLKRTQSNSPNTERVVYMDSPISISLIPSIGSQNIPGFTTYTTSNFMSYNTDNNPFVFCIDTQGLTGIGSNEEYVFQQGITGLYDAISMGVDTSFDDEQDIEKISALWEKENLTYNQMKSGLAGLKQRSSGRSTRSTVYLENSNEAIASNSIQQPTPIEKKTPLIKIIQTYVGNLFINFGKIIKGEKLKIYQNELIKVRTKCKKCKGTGFKVKLSKINEVKEKCNNDPLLKEYITKNTCKKCAGNGEILLDISKKDVDTISKLVENKRILFKDGWKIYF